MKANRLHGRIGTFPVGRRTILHASRHEASSETSRVWVDVRGNKWEKKAHFGQQELPEHFDREVGCLARILCCLAKILSKAGEGLFCEAWGGAFRLGLAWSGLTEGVKLAVSIFFGTTLATLRTGAGEASCAADTVFDSLTFARTGPVEADSVIPTATPIIVIAEKITRNNAIFFIVIKKAPFRMIA